METLFGLVLIVALIAMSYFIVRAVICKIKKTEGAGAAIKKAGVSAVVFIIAVAFSAQVTPSQPKSAEPEQQDTQTPVYDVAADKQALTDYVNSTVGAKYTIKNLSVSEYSDGVYQINIECRDSKYSDAESAKAAGKEIRELMSDFPCKVDMVAITFKGGLITYDPASPKMQIVAEGKKSEF